MKVANAKEFGRVAVVMGGQSAEREVSLDSGRNVLAEADVLVLTEIYPAGEAPIAGADGRALARAVRARGKVDPVLIEHPRDITTALPPLLADGDLLLLMGAGDIGAAANALAAAATLRNTKVEK